MKPTRKSPSTPPRAKGMARLYYAHPKSMEGFSDLLLSGKPFLAATMPVALLSLSPEDCKAREELVAKAIHESDKRAKLYSARMSWSASPSWHQHNCLRRARAALSLVAGRKE